MGSLGNFSNQGDKHAMQVVGNKSGIMLEKA
jgi:hypothetical protein